MKFFTAETDASDQIFSHSFDTAGEYTINISAYNLHMDETYGAVGYKHNMTRTVVVQMPVVGWELDISPNWIDTNGGAWPCGWSLELNGSCCSVQGPAEVSQGFLPSDRSNALL